MTRPNSYSEKSPDSSVQERGSEQDESLDRRAGPRNTPDNGHIGADGTV